MQLAFIAHVGFYILSLLLRNSYTGPMEPIGTQITTNVEPVAKQNNPSFTPILLPMKGSRLDDSQRAREPVGIFVQDLLVVSDSFGNIRVTKLTEQV